MKKYTRYKGKEDDLQITCMDYLRAQYPNVLAIHVANEGISGRKGKIYGAKMKRKGVVSGVPDILIFKPLLELQWAHKDLDGVELSCGLAIELKAGYNKPSETQIQFMDKLETEGGWACRVVWSFDEFKDIVDDYLADDGL